MDYSIRSCHAHFGVSRTTIDILWQHLLSLEYDFGFQLKHLLWVLYFLKVYNTDDINAIRWNVDIKTFKKWTFKMIFVLYNTLHSVSISNCNINI